VTSTRQDRAVRTARRRRGGWAVAALAVLGACQSPEVLVVPPVPGAPAATQADPAIAVLPPEPVIDDDPRRLMGIGPDALRAALGEPELVRREIPAEIWQYRGAVCVFDVFLYDTGGRAMVTYVEARDGAAQRIEPRACLNELLRARLERPLS
jgi:hypothetical protein